MEIRTEKRPTSALRVLLPLLMLLLSAPYALAGDWNGDALDSVGLYVPNSGVWLLRNTPASRSTDNQFRFGPKASSWWPIAGDWNGDGVDTVGLYAPDRALFLLRNTHSSGPVDDRIRFGSAGSGWLPLVGDWDGDGVDTPGLYNPLAGVFYLRNSGGGGRAEHVFRLGPRESGLLPIAGDWNGDGIDTVGLYDPGRGIFLLRNRHASGTVDIRVRFGPRGRQWAPMAGDWNGDSVDTVALYDPTKGTFHLRNSHVPGAAHATYRFGKAGAGWVAVGSSLRQEKSGPDSAQQRMLDLVNQARAQLRTCGARGTFPAAAALKWNDQLAVAAQRHSDDMAQTDFFSHTGSDGSNVSVRTERAGYEWRRVGENIAAGYTSVESAMAAWLKSDGHCANIMGEGFQEFGSAVSEKPGSTYRIYWTQVFGTHNPSAML